MSVQLVNFYGIGNAVMQIPFIKAMKSIGERVTVVVDKSRSTEHVYEGVADDVVSNASGKTFSYTVWTHRRERERLLGKSKHNLYIEDKLASIKKTYMWRFVKHEIEYLMDAAKEIGYRGVIPPMTLPSREFSVTDDSVAIGVGYFGTQYCRKHWGNDNYVLLCKELIKMGAFPIIVGDARDSSMSGSYIKEKVPGVVNSCGTIKLPLSIAMLTNLQYYIGNDTGMMHVHNAGKYGKNTLAIFMKGASNPVKNYPWNGKNYLIEPRVIDVIDRFKSIVKNSKYPPV